MGLLRLGPRQAAVTRPFNKTQSGLLQAIGKQEIITPSAARGNIKTKRERNKLNFDLLLYQQTTVIKLNYYNCFKSGRCFHCC